MPNTLSDLPEEAIVRIESKLFKTYAQLAAIIDSSEDAIISMDLTNRIQSWNKAAENIYGYKTSEVIGRNISLLWPAEHSDEIDELTKKVLAKEPVKNHESGHVKKNGSEIEVSLTLSPVKDDRDEVYGLSMISRDITEEKNAQEKLSKFEEVNRLNKLMVDRELKMIELKEKISQLESRLKAQS